MALAATSTGTASSISSLNHRMCTNAPSLCTVRQLAPGSLCTGRQVSVTTSASCSPSSFAPSSFSFRSDQQRTNMAMAVSRPSSILRYGPSSRGKNLKAAVGGSNSARVVCHVAVQAKAPITLHLGEASLTVPFSVETGKELEAAIAALLATFREKEKATRPQRWQNMEFVHKGDIANGDVFLEIFCNPNACSQPFQAKVMITMKDDRVKFSSEAQLSDLQADLGAYLEANN